jgi:two-component system alkaline phosphatase synthesis response regulator PhoP
MESSHSEAKLNVLVVDDNDCIREVLTALLSHKGYRCESAANGREAIEKVAQDHFDVVITDVHMPEMDGITLTRELTLRFSDLPVMIMTGQLDDHCRESAFTAGAREVLGKPFEIAELMVRLHKVVDTQNLNEEQRV